MVASESSPRPPLILVANDQEWSARSLESILAPEGYDVLRAFTGRQALERAGTSHPDLAIIDLQLPDIDGLEVCRLLREDPRFSDTTPVIITTAGPSGRAQRLDAYEAGAWEFLGQPLDGEALLLKMKTYLRSRIAVELERDRSTVDAATGLYNRRGLAQRAREIGSEAYRHSHPLACVVFAPAVSKDSEANTTDEEAENIGVAVGKLFRKMGRVSDAIGRLGPTEFAIIAPATDDDGAMKMVNRLRAVVEAESHDGDGVSRLVILRAGYSVVPDFREAEVGATELLLRATTALRQIATDSQDDSAIRSFDLTGAEPSQ
ncbi:MAG: response regulator [Gemmatimonadales bacterium]